jgi:hypothetical protein
MSEPTTNQTLDIQGTTNTHTKVILKLGGAVALVGLGIFLWLLCGTSGGANTEGGAAFGVFAVVSFIVGALLPFSENIYIYLDFTDRQIVTVVHNAWCQTSKRCRPLTDFSHIVVRHLCHPGGEGADTYTGSVGLKPVDGKAVLWVKDFPTTEDEVPRAANEFARKLQEMTGLPVALIGEFKNETH